MLIWGFLNYKFMSVQYKIFLKSALFLLLFVIYSSSVYSASSILKYNSFTNSWDNAQPDSQLKYNSFNNSWEYAQPGSQLKYNSFTNSWSYE